MLYTAGVKNWDFAKAENVRFKSLGMGYCAHTGAISNDLKMAFSAKAKTNSSFTMCIYTEVLRIHVVTSTKI